MKKKAKKKKKKAKKKRQCEACRRWFEEMNSPDPDMCLDCYEKRWDENFSSQADYSDKLLEEEEE